MLQKAVQPYSKCPARALDCSLKLGCMPCPTLESWQLHRHLHHPTRSARLIRTSFLSCIPSPGTAPALGVEGMQSWAWSLCLHRSGVSLHGKCGSGSAALLAWDTSAICIQVSALAALGVQSASCLQADPKVPLISSHLCCLIPGEAACSFLRQWSFPRQPLETGNIGTCNFLKDLLWA